MEEEEIHGAQGHGFCTQAQFRTYSTDVLVLYTIFIVKMTADSVKLYIAKTTSMMTIKRE
jgi:hypothetical protein